MHTALRPSATTAPRTAVLPPRAPGAPACLAHARSRVRAGMQVMRRRRAGELAGVGRRGEASVRVTASGEARTARVIRSTEEVSTLPSHTHAARPGPIRVCTLHRVVPCHFHPPPTRTGKRVGLGFKALDLTTQGDLKARLVLGLQGVCSHALAGAWTGDGHAGGGDTWMRK
jgi:hypothetical protein